MNEKNIFLHIGMPKCGSTSIQYSLSKCNQIDYIGFLPEKTDGLFWRDDEFAVLFDRILRFSCENELYWKKKIDEYISNSEKDVVVFSSENITLRFLPWDLPTHIKLDFIKKIFPSKTKFIYVYKNPVELLVSLYKEWVLMGYKHNFNYFCDELYKYNDISMFSDFLLNNFLENFGKFFDTERLNLLSLHEGIICDIEKVLNVNLNYKSKKNRSIDMLDAEIIRSYNNNINDYDSFFDSIEMHRAYFNIDENEKYNQARKRLVRKGITKGIKNYYGNTKNNTTLNSEIKDILISDLTRAKDKLQKLNYSRFGEVLQKYIIEVSNG